MQTSLWLWQALSWPWQEVSLTSIKSCGGFFFPQQIPLCLILSTSPLIFRYRYPVKSSAGQQHWHINCEGLLKGLYDLIKTSFPVRGVDTSYKCSVYLFIIFFNFRWSCLIFKKLYMWTDLKHEYLRGKIRGFMSDKNLNSKNYGGREINKISTLWCYHLIQMWPLLIILSLFLSRGST